MLDQASIHLSGVVFAKIWVLFIRRAKNLLGGPSVPAQLRLKCSKLQIIWGNLVLERCFSIQTNSGKDIRAHSYFENEDEIVLPPGLYFRVVGYLNPAEDLHVIQLREIAPPYVTLAEPFDLSQMKKELPKIEPVLPPVKPQTTSQYSAASVTPKPSVQPSSKKRKLMTFSCLRRIIVKHISSVYLTLFCMSHREVEQFRQLPKVIYFLGNSLQRCTSIIGRIQSKKDRKFNSFFRLYVKYRRNWLDFLQVSENEWLVSLLSL